MHIDFVRNILRTVVVSNSNTNELPYTKIIDENDNEVCRMKQGISGHAVNRAMELVHRSNSHQTMLSALQEALYTLSQPDCSEDERKKTRSIVNDALNLVELLQRDRPTQE